MVWRTVVGDKLDFQNSIMIHPWLTCEAHMWATIRLYCIILSLMCKAAWYVDSHPLSIFFNHALDQQMLFWISCEKRSFTNCHVVSRRFLYNVLVRHQTVTESNRALLVETLRSISEIMIWGDQNDSSVFE